MSVDFGLRVIVEMMESELTGRVGPKHARIPERTASRVASAPGRWCWAAAAADCAEVQLEAHATLPPTTY